jgi:hypothetical protein
MAWGEQFYNPQTGTYETVGQNGYTENPFTPPEKTPAQVAEEAAILAGYQKKDPNSTFSREWVPGRQETTGEGGGYAQVGGHWQDNASWDYNKFLPKALVGKIDAKTASQLQYFKEDPRKSGKRLRDPSQVGYDPE